MFGESKTFSYDFASVGEKLWRKIDKKLHVVSSLWWWMRSGESLIPAGRIMDFFLSPTVMGADYYNSVNIHPCHEFYAFRSRNPLPLTSSSFHVRRDADDWWFRSKNRKLLPAKKSWGCFFSWKVAGESSTSSSEHDNVKHNRKKSSSFYMKRVHDISLKASLGANFYDMLIWKSI